MASNARLYIAITYRFYHPFLKEQLELECPLPDDFDTLISQLSKNNLS